MDYGRIGELADEFTTLWERLHAYYLDSAIGFSSVLSSVENEQKRAMEFVRVSEFDSVLFQDKRMFSYDGLPVEGVAASALHRSTQGETKARNSPGGENFATLGQLCILSFYDFWQDYMRREYVIAKGKLDRGASKGDVEAATREYAGFDIWGDFRHLRNAISHNRGVATEDCEKCKLIKMFKRGERIIFSPDHMRVVFVALLAFRNTVDAERHPKVVIYLGSD